MIKSIRRTLPLVLALYAVGAHAQFLNRFEFYKQKGASMSVGATGNFTTVLTTNPNNVATIPMTGRTNTTAGNQQQYTTDSVGFVTSINFHPVAFAGIELNYGFTHYSERFGFTYANTGAANTVNVPTDVHEFTGAYSFHPKRIPFQPFVNVGGGAIDFTPSNASNQFRGAGLLEVGFDLPVKNSPVGFRIEGRSLYYRAPNFYTPQISTRSWRVTEQPSVSAYYRF